MSSENPDRVPMVYGYTRVSTDYQAQEGLSLEDQEIKLRRFYENTLAGAKWGGIFQDGGVSGKTPFNSRPAGKVLYGRLRPGDHVCMTRLDRGFRNFKDCVNVTESWLEKGVHIHLLDMGMSTNTPAGRFMHRIFAALAEMMREIIVENITAGVRRKKEKYGRHHGKFGIGWKNGGSGKKPKKVPFVEERRQMALIVHLIDDWGLSLPDVENLFHYYNFNLSPGGFVWNVMRIHKAFKAYITEGMTDPCCQFPPPADYKPPRAKRQKPWRGANENDPNPTKRWCPPPDDLFLQIRVTDATIPLRVMRSLSTGQETYSLPVLPGHRLPSRRSALASPRATCIPASGGARSTPTATASNTAKSDAASPKVECAAADPSSSTTVSATSSPSPACPTSSST